MNRAVYNYSEIGKRWRQDLRQIKLFAEKGRILQSTDAKEIFLF